MKPKISVCIITKNEEAFIAECLNSVLPVADEIIVLDTGSTDQTREIIKNYLAGGQTALQNCPVQLYETVWQDDFSKARNECITYASGDWILSIDADEVLTDESRKNLRPFIETIKDQNRPLIFSLKIIQPAENTIYFYRHSLFRNGFAIKYVFPLHEQLQSSEPDLIYQNCPNLSIYHLGENRRKEQLDNKLDDYIDQLNKAISDSKDDFEKIYFTFYLANACYGSGETQKALNLYHQSLDLAAKVNYDKNSSFYGNILRNAAIALVNEKKYSQALTLVKVMLNLSPDFPDGLFYYAFCLQNLSSFAKAIEIYNKALNLLELEPENNLNPKGLISQGKGLEINIICELSRCLIISGQNSAALDLLNQLFSRSGSNFRVLVLLMLAHLLENNLALALKYYFLENPDLPEQDKQEMQQASKLPFTNELYQRTMSRFLKGIEQLEGWLKEEKQLIQTKIDSLTPAETTKDNSEQLASCYKFYRQALEYSKAGDHVQALHDLCEAYTLYNENDLPVKTPFYAELILVSIGEFLLFEKYQEALAFIDELLYLLPDFPDALFYKALCQQKLGNKQAASEIYHYTLDLLQQNINLNPLNIMSRDQDLIEDINKNLENI